MSDSGLRIRRATTDDFHDLQALWQSMRFPSAELEKRLTEFQVVETASGQLAGAVGLDINGQHARLHSEGYTDFSLADAARDMFWDRIRTIASHHGVLRLWTQEQSPFWVRWGFQPAPADVLERLPAEWKGYEAPWLTLQLKDEATLAAMEKELATFKEQEKQRTAETLGQARTLKTAITVIGFGIGFIGLTIAFIILTRRGLILPGH